MINETFLGGEADQLKSYFSLRPTDCAESHLAYHLLWRPYYETKYFADERGISWLQKIDYDDQATRCFQSVKSSICGRIFAGFRIIYRNRR